MICKDRIMEWIRYCNQPQAVHEIGIIGYSQNNIATRLNELEREGLLISNFRHGKRVKEWGLSDGSKFQYDQSGQGIFI